MTQNATKKNVKATTSESIQLTQQVESTIQTDISQDPVALQYIPSEKEKVISIHETSDPIGDEAHSPVAGIVHRHQDRALLKITDTCDLYCRFCFRKEMVNQGKGALKTEELDQAINYIAAHPEIHEVILTGGDPLTLSNRRLKPILSRLEMIDHIDVIRFHTRSPIVNPARVDPIFLDMINGISKAVYIVLHINHAQELNKTVQDMLEHLSRSRAVLLSQSVLLKNINDNADILENLFKTLVQNRIKPYYLHHPDLAPGTGHFRVSIEQGQKIMATLQTKMSGLCLPTYVLDIPGGFSKIPLDKTFIESKNKETYILRDPQGRIHHYQDIIEETND